MKKDIVDNYFFVRVSFFYNKRLAKVEDLLFKSKGHDKTMSKARSNG